MVPILSIYNKESCRPRRGEVVECSLATGPLRKKLGMVCVVLGCKSQVLSPRWYPVGR